MSADICVDPCIFHYMKKYEFIEHTADIAVRVYGADLEELFKNATDALFVALTDNKPVSIKEKKVDLEAETLEDLFINWLNELISSFFADRFFPADYSIKVEDAPRVKKLHACLRGQDFNPYENKINMEIKAATYHDLKIEKIKGIYQAEIIFDV